MKKKTKMKLTKKQTDQLSQLDNDLDELLTRYQDLPPSTVIGLLQHRIVSAALFCAPNPAEAWQLLSNASALALESYNNKEEEKNHEDTN